MPEVEVNVAMSATVDRVWSAVTEVEDYPRFMESVRRVSVIENLSDGSRLTAWSVTLKGSTLEWTEREVMHHGERRLEFEQVEGDLDRFRGAWSVTAAPGGGVNVRLEVDFDIGIPLLADMLNPVAARALQENSEQMLRGIERQVVLQ
jgi:ribosome-associated toxin RatA of RatAB toxin-antitoxin module